MRYLMLFLFPPVGIVMYLRDEFGPPKKIRYIVCALSMIWMICVIAMLVRIPMGNKQDKIQMESEIFDDPNAGKIENKVENMKKADFDKLSDREKAEKMKSYLADAIGDYAAIRFDDGTGIQFPGADISNVAWYGKMSNDGQIEMTYGEIKIENGVYNYTAYAKEDLMQLDIERNIPDKYKSDGTESKVRKVSDGYYLTFTAVCENPTDKDYNAIIEVAKKYGVTSGQITFIDSYKSVMGRKSWPSERQSAESDSEIVDRTSLKGGK